MINYAAYTQLDLDWLGLSVFYIYSWERFQSNREEDMYVTSFRIGWALAHPYKQNKPGESFENTTPTYLHYFVWIGLCFEAPI